MKFKKLYFYDLRKVQQCIPNETKGREVLFLQALTLHYALIEVYTNTYREDLAQYIFIAYIT